MRHAASFVSVALAAAAGSMALALIGSHVMSKEPRFPQLTTEQLTDAQRPLAEEIMKVSSVGLGGPYNPLLRSPVLGDPGPARRCADMRAAAASAPSASTVPKPTLSL